MTAAHGWLMASERPWQEEYEPDVWFYRHRTMALLKRYARASVEVGRLPSLLGRECFRSRLTSYSMNSFEDIVIFVHDMEQAIRRLDPLQKRLVAMNVLEEYSPAEVARLLQCSLRSIERFIPEAVDELTRVLLAVGLIERTATGNGGANSCQGGKNSDFLVRRCN